MDWKFDQTCIITSETTIYTGNKRSCKLNVYQKTSWKQSEKVSFMNRIVLMSVRFSPSKSTFDSSGHSILCSSRTWNIKVKFISAAFLTWKYKSCQYQMVFTLASTIGRLKCLQVRTLIGHLTYLYSTDLWRMLSWGTKKHKSFKVQKDERTLSSCFRFFRAWLISLSYCNCFFQSRICCSSCSKANMMKSVSRANTVDKVR